MKKISSAVLNDDGDVDDVIRVSYPAQLKGFKTFYINYNISPALYRACAPDSELSRLLAQPTRSRAWQYCD